MPTTAPTTFASLPLDVLETILINLDALADSASARLACRALARAGARPLRRLARAAHLGRRALRAHRTTLLLRRALVGHVIAEALAEEADEHEAEEVALMLFGRGGAAEDGGGSGSGSGSSSSSSLAREQRSAEAAYVRRSARAALDAAVALARGAAPAPQQLLLASPPCGGWPPRGEAAAARLAALVALSPDPLEDVLAAAHRALEVAGDHPPLPALVARGDGGAVAAYLRAKRAAVTAAARHELSCVVRAAERLWEEARGGEEEEEGEEGEEEEEEEEDETMSEAAAWGTGGGAGGLLSHVVLLPQPPTPGGSEDDDDDADDAANNHEGDDDVAHPAAAPAIAATADASVQTSGGGGHFGPSLETVRLLQRELAHIALRTAPETLALLERCLVRELRAWEGLPTPLP
jgi:hypothetical protein